MTESFWVGFVKEAASSETEEKAKKSYSFHLLGGRHKMTEDQKERTDLEKEIADRGHAERMDAKLKGTHPFMTAGGALAGGAAGLGGALAAGGKYPKSMAALGALLGGGAGHLMGRYGRASNLSKQEAAKDRLEGYHKSVL